MIKININILKQPETQKGVLVFRMVALSWNKSTQDNGQAHQQNFT